MSTKLLGPLLVLALALPARGQDAPSDADLNAAPRQPVFQPAPERVEPSPAVRLDLAPAAAALNKMWAGSTGAAAAHAPVAPGNYPGATSIAATAQEFEADAAGVPDGVPLAPVSGATSPATTSPLANPVLGLSLKDPSDIGPAEARTILSGTGLLRGKMKLSDALRALRFTHTYTKGKKVRSTDDVALTPQQQTWLFVDYMQLKRALTDHPDSPVIDESDPQFQTWVAAAADQLKHVPAAQRQPLFESLLRQETTKVHWRNSTPIESPVGATGFSQLLAETADKVGVNRFDPEQNLMGAARFLDDLIAQYGLTGGLAYYNGGDHPPAASFAYARAIESRVSGLPPGSSEPDRARKPR